MMRHFIEPLDCDGNEIHLGNDVQLVSLPDSFLDDLPLEDQEAIKDQLGKKFKLSNFDDYGYAEIEFEYEHNSGKIFHTIFVEPFCLKKI